LSQWIRLEGKITRIGNESVAICLTPTPALVRLVDAVTAASRARDRVISVILIDEDTARRKLLAEAFRIVGCSLIEAATSLEAIVRLGESSFEPDVIAVADSGSATTAADLRAFVERMHASAKLIAIGNDPGAPDGIIHWLSSANPDGDLANRIR